MKWKVHYVDGKGFSDQDGAPEDAPGDGVLAVSHEDETVGVIVEHGNDFYLYDFERYEGWVGVDWFGLAQYLAEPGKKIVKMGEATGTKTYRALLLALRDDPYMPAKSARYPWEPRT